MGRLIGNEIQVLKMLGDENQTTRQQMETFYTLCDQMLQQVDKTKYIVIIICDDLSWTPPPQIKCYKLSTRLTKKKL